MSSQKSLPLTLIVAATPNMGIGVRGALPWRLRGEMQYFVRVTTRIPEHQSIEPPGAQVSQPKPIQNAVIMGRKTWESIPKKFRPLKGRLNVVLSSSVDKPTTRDGALWVSSLSRAIQTLESLRADKRETDESSTTTDEPASSLDPELANLPRVANAFITGGAAVYRASLEYPQATNILLTRVYGDWDCDTFFPVDPDQDHQWERKSLKALNEWTGEEIPEGRLEEGGVEYEYTLYQRSK